MTRSPVSVERLRQHVAELAREPRPPESSVLERSRQYVESHLAGAGWSVRRHAFRVVTEVGQPLWGVNLIATPRSQQNSSATRPARPRFCLGAHLDSRPETPGADDNASGVAALLEVARLLASLNFAELPIDLELVVFDLEEAGMLGGAEHARLVKEQRIDLRGMIALEMLAYCDHRPKSQKLPRALVGKYSETGNFIAVIGNQASGRLIERFAGGMKQVADLPVETLAVPENGNYLQATRLSDHSPFWDAGYSALMITDTSFLRNPHYHLPSDTPETLDFDFLRRVTKGTDHAVHEIATRGL